MRIPWIDNLRKQRGNASGDMPDTGDVAAALLPSGRNYIPRTSQNILALWAESPWLRLVSQRVADAVAAVNWRLYVARNNDGSAYRDLTVQRAKGAKRHAIIRKATSADGNLEELPSDHPVLNLLHDGNAYLSGDEVMQLIVLSLDLVGEAYSAIETNKAGVPTALVPLKSTWIQRLPIANDPYFLVRSSAKSVKIHKDSMLIWRRVSPNEPFGRGTGLANAIGRELDADGFASNYSATWFQNCARPDLLIYGEMSKSDMERLERAWNSKHQGVGNWFKARFIRGASQLGVKEISQPFRAGDVTELRRFERDITLQTFGIPPEIVGIVENSNRATITTADYLFQKLCVVPRLEMLQSVFQKHLVPYFDERLIIAYDNPVPADDDYKLKVMESAPWAFDVDAWRSMADKGPMEDGQGRYHLVPLNLMPMDSFGPAISSDSEVVDEDEQSSEDETDAEDLYQYESVVRDVIGPGDVPPITETDVNQIAASCDEYELVEVIKPQELACVESFGAQAVAAIGSGISFDISNPRAIEFLAKNAAERMNMVNVVTQDRVKAKLQEVREAISAGVLRGDPLDELQSAIEDVFGWSKRYRSQLIARTEVTRASNFGRLEGYRQAGIEKKQWLATRGGNNRDTHMPGAGLDGQVRDEGDPFESPSGHEAQYPCDFGVAEEDCNCQCSVLPYLDDRQLSEDVLTREYRAYASNRPQFERGYVAALQRAFDKQQTTVVARLRNIARSRGGQET